MLKVGGIWVSPVEIEARLMEHERVFEAAVVGREDEDELVKPEAFVVLKEASEACDSLAEDLRAFCREGLARYKYPRWVSFVDELPKTATGKKIGSASCRERVCKYVSIAVVAGSLKKKQ